MLFLLQGPIGHKISLVKQYIIIIVNQDLLIEFVHWRAKRVTQFRGRGWGRGQGGLNPVTKPVFQR